MSGEPMSVTSVRWRLITIMTNHGPIEWPAFDSGVPGLVICPATDEVEAVASGWWSLTQESSGLKVAQWPHPWGADRSGASGRVADGLDQAETVEGDGRGVREDPPGVDQRGMDGADTVSDVARAQRIAAMGRTAVVNGAPRSDIIDYATASLACIDDVDDVALSLASYVAQVAEIKQLSPADFALFAGVVLCYGQRINELGGIHT